MSALTASTRPAVPAHARALAARLSALFERDRGIVARLNDAQRALAGANERLSLGLTPEAIGPRPGVGPGPPVAVPGALSEIHWRIHRAFCDYQTACEERRQLAFDVGELAQQLTDTLCAAGFTRQDARNADVHQLARARASDHRAPANTGPPGPAAEISRNPW